MGVILPRSPEVPSKISVTRHGGLLLVSSTYVPRGGRPGAEQTEEAEEITDLATVQSVDKQRPLEPLQPLQPLPQYHSLTHRQHTWIL